MSTDEYEESEGLIGDVSGISEYNIESTYNVSCFQEFGSHLLYRALRADELGTYISTGMLLPPCNPCPGQYCCDISPSQHVTSGSRAKLKSSWISTTTEPAIAALWSSARKNKEGSVVRLTGKFSSGLFAVINPAIPPALEIYNPVTDPNIGITGRNAAAASREILIKNRIPFSNIVGFCQCEQVSLKVYNDWTGGKVRGQRKAGGTTFNVIWGPITNTPADYLEKLQHYARVGLDKRFVSAVGGKTTKYNKNKTTKYKTKLK